MSSILQTLKRLILADHSDEPILKLTKKERNSTRVSTRELIQRESNTARTIFGNLPSNVARREFFNLDPDTWIWHEEVKDSFGAKREVTTRYELKPQGVLKIQPGPRYSYIDGQELQNFYNAVNAYYNCVTREIYKVDSMTGASL